MCMELLKVIDNKKCNNMTTLWRLSNWGGSDQLAQCQGATKALQAESEGEEKEPEFDKQNNATMAESKEWE